MFLRWLKKWWLPFVITAVVVAGGIVYITIAFNRGGFDLDTSRYLLSAIVQSLAALLAIIFAGVAILWSHEAQVIARLEVLRPVYYELFGRMIPENTSTNLIEQTRFFLREILLDPIPSVRKGVRKTYRELNETPLKTFRNMSSWACFESCLSCPSETQIQEGIRDVANIVRAGRESVEIHGFKEFEETSRNPSGLFRLIRNVNSYIRMIETTHIPSSGYGEEPFSSTRYAHYEIFRQMIRDGINHLLGVVDRGRTARDFLFVILTILYIFTIAFGMGSLSLLTDGGCLGQVECNFGLTWLTLAFAFITLAFTFTYLYRLVKGGKEV